MLLCQTNGNRSFLMLSLLSSLSLLSFPVLHVYVMLCDIHSLSVLLRFQIMVSNNDVTDVVRYDVISVRSLVHMSAAGFRFFVVLFFLWVFLKSLQTSHSSTYYSINWFIHDIVLQHYMYIKAMLYFWTTVRWSWLNNHGIIETWASDITWTSLYNELFSLNIT